MPFFPIPHPEQRNSGVRTTGATATTIFQKVVKKNEAITIQALVAASRNETSVSGNAGDAALYWLIGSFRDTEGTLEQVGTTIKDASEIDTAYDADFAVSGSNAIIQVTGKATTVIDWACTATILKVK